MEVVHVYMNMNEKNLWLVYVIYALVVLFVYVTLRKTEYIYNVRQDLGRFYLKTQYLAYFVEKK